MRAFYPSVLFDRAGSVIPDYARNGDPGPLEAKRPGQGPRAERFVRHYRLRHGRGCPAVGRSPGEGDQACRLRHVTDDKSLSNRHSQAVTERTHRTLKSAATPDSLFVYGPQPLFLCSVPAQTIREANMQADHIMFAVSGAATLGWCVALSWAFGL